VIIGLESQPQRKGGVLTQEASDSLILLPVENGEYFALNEVGARVWELCDGSNSVSEMVDVIGREYNAPLEVVTTDVLEVLTDLMNEKLLVGDP
jgi:hypothetical protein